MIRHIELVDRKTEIAYADKYVDEEQYAEYRRLSIDGDFYVRIVKKEIMETNSYKKAVNNAVEIIKSGDLGAEWDACGIGEEKENEAWSEAWRIVNAPESGE